MRITPNQLGFSLAPSMIASGFVSWISSTRVAGSIGIWVTKSLMLWLRPFSVSTIGFLQLAPWPPGPEMVIDLMLLFSPARRGASR